MFQFYETLITHTVINDLFITISSKESDDLLLSSSKVLAPFLPIQ